MAGGELPGVGWQRCVAHLERRTRPLTCRPPRPSGWPRTSRGDLFEVRREKTARGALAEEYVELYGGRLPKAVSVFEAGIEDALTYLADTLGLAPLLSGIRTTNMLERLFKEVKKRTRVEGVFPNETGASTPATAIALRSSEE